MPRGTTPAYRALRFAHDQRLKDAPPRTERPQPRRERRVYFGCAHCHAKWFQTAGARPDHCAVCNCRLPVNHEGAPPEQLEERLVEIDDATGVETIIHSKPNDTYTNRRDMR